MGKFLIFNLILWYKTSTYDAMNIWLAKSSDLNLFVRLDMKKCYTTMYLFLIVWFNYQLSLTSSVLFKFHTIKSFLYRMSMYFIKSYIFSQSIYVLHIVCTGFHKLIEWYKIWILCDTMVKLKICIIDHTNHLKVKHWYDKSMRDMLYFVCLIFKFSCSN